MREGLSPRPRNGARVDRWIRAALVAAAVAPFFRTLFYGFVYDDSVILLHNPVITGWHAVAEVWRHPYWYNGGPDRPGLYRPMLMLWFAIVSNLGHGYAIALHAFAVALHVAATLLAAALLRRGLGRWPAAAAAFWFAVHPVHVEAVASVANSSEVLVCIWTILLAFCIWPRSGAGGAVDAPGWRRATVAALLYAAALLTKESGAVAPALALLVALGWRPAGSTTLRDAAHRWRGWLRVILLWLVALVGVMIARRVVLGGLTGTSSMAVPGLAGLSGPQRVWAMLSTGGDVARLLLWPTEQSPDYGPTTLLTGHARDVAALATIVAIVLLVVQSVRRAIRAECPDSRPLAAIGWGLAAYFPASNLLGATGPILAERTLYGVSLGAALLLGWSIERAYDVLRRRAGARLVPAAAVWLASAGTIVAVCVRGFERTAEYARVWRDHPSLFAQIVRADSLNYRGYQLLAMEAQNHDRFDDAARLYQRAYELRPSEPTVMASYGEFLLQVHRPHDALAMAERLFRDRDVWTDPRAVTLYLNAVAATRGVDSVLAAARRLDARAPSARAVLFIGMAYDARGDSAAARAAYRAGLQRSPGDSALAAHLAGRPAQ